MKSKEFAVGESVVWSDGSNFIRDELTKQYGIGPFTVKHVESVPDTCVCGDALDAYGVCSSCGKYTMSVRKSVGHSQWLMIEVDGKVVVEKFSGFLFKHV